MYRLALLSLLLFNACAVRLYYVPPPETPRKSIKCLFSEGQLDSAQTAADAATKLNPDYIVDSVTTVVYDTLIFRIHTVHMTHADSIGDAQLRDLNASNVVSR
jgi:hypothetical protein